MLNNKISAIDHNFWNVDFNQHLSMETVTEPFLILMLLYSPNFSVQYKNRIYDTKKNKQKQQKFIGGQSFFTAL